MALPKKGFRKILVGGNQFLWKVRNKTSWNEIHDGALGIPIQHVDGGQLLVVTIGYSRSYFEQNNEFQITPAMIEKCVLKAQKLGWNYKVNGPVFKIDCSETINGEE